VDGSAACGEQSLRISPEQGLAELCVGWQKTPIPALRIGTGRRCAKGGIRGEYAAARWEFENETESHCLDFLAPAKSTTV